MFETLVWAVTTLAIASAVIWRTDRYQNHRLELERVGQAQVDHQTTRSVELMERQTTAEIAARTTDATVELTNAKAEQEIAEIRTQTKLIGTLHEDHLAAQRLIIAANAEARVALASELARAEHSNTPAIDIVEQYTRYLAAMQNHGSSDECLDFDDFCKTLRTHSQS